MKLSVILPTFNRADILKRSLERLAAQQGAEFEVIVVDDGSSKETQTVLAAASRTMPNLKTVRQANAGQAAARNRGFKEAIGTQGGAEGHPLCPLWGQLILFFQDDTLAVGTDFLARHMEFHQKNPAEEAVCLGQTVWDPALKINAYMRFLDASGWQFGYRFLKAGWITHSRPFQFFYTSNVSLKASLFAKTGFDSGFKSYGWEDIDLGYRLWKQHGMRLYYEPRALAHHHHPMTEKDLPARMEKIGASAVFFHRLHPDSGRIPSGPKKWLIRAASFRPALWLGRFFGKAFYLRLLSYHHFWRGVKRQLATEPS